MSDASSRNKSLGFVSILAMITLVASAAWSSWGCSGSTQKPAATNTNTTSPPSDDDDDVHVKVDLPDTVTIKP